MRALQILSTLTTVCLVGIATATAAAAGVTEKLPSGVVVVHSKQGSGEAPAANSNVRVHYRGTLANGTEFDSSYKRNKPISFSLQGVIPCWTQGVQKMKVGGKAMLTCPSATAYGARGVPGVIPADSVLTFEVELLAVER